MLFKIVESFNKLEEELLNENTVIEGNQITGSLPPALDQFLMDCAQMYCNFDYIDISKFAERATEEDIKLLRKLKTKINLEFRMGAESDEEFMQALFNQVTELIKGN